MKNVFCILRTNSSKDWNRIIVAFLGLSVFHWCLYFYFSSSQDGFSRWGPSQHKHISCKRTFLRNDSTIKEGIWCSISLSRQEESGREDYLMPKNYFSQRQLWNTACFSAVTLVISETVSVFLCECLLWLDTPLTWDNQLRKATIVICIVVQFVKKNGLIWLKVDLNWWQQDLK